MNIFEILLIQKLIRELFARNPKAAFAAVYFAFKPPQPIFAKVLCHWLHYCCFQLINADFVLLASIAASFTVVSAVARFTAASIEKSTAATLTLRS